MRLEFTANRRSKYFREIRGPNEARSGVGLFQPHPAKPNKYKQSKSHRVTISVLKTGTVTGPHALPCCSKQLIPLRVTFDSAYQVATLRIKLKHVKILSMKLEGGCRRAVYP